MDNQLKAFRFPPKKVSRSFFVMIGKIKLFIKKILVLFAISKIFVVQFSFLIQELGPNLFFFRGSLYQNTSTDE